MPLVVSIKTRFLISTGRLDILARGAAVEEIGSACRVLLLSLSCISFDSSESEAKASSLPMDLYAEDMFELCVGLARAC